MASGVIYIPIKEFGGLGSFLSALASCLDAARLFPDQVFFMHTDPICAPSVPGLDWELFFLYHG